MLDYLQILTDGGPPTWTVVGLGLAAGAGALFVQQVVGFLKWRVPASLGWVPLTLTLVLTSTLASWQVGYARAATSAMQVASSTSAALSVAMSGTLVVGLAFLGLSCTGWLPLLVAPGPKSRIHLGGILDAFVGGLVGLGLTVLGITMSVGWGQLPELGVWLFVLPVLAVLPCFGIVLSSLRVSDDLLHQGRMAAGRVGLGCAAFVGLGLLGEHARCVGLIETFMAVATVSSDRSGELLQLGFQRAVLPSGLGWSVGLLPLCVGLGGGLPLFGSVESRELGATAVAGMQTLVVIFAVGFLGSVLGKLAGLLLAPTGG